MGRRYLRRLMNDTQGGRPAAPSIKAQSTSVAPLLGVLASLALMATLVASSALAQTIVGSGHDLSTPQTDEVCVFCHTPHLANPTAQGPLWKRTTIRSRSPTR